MRTAWGGSVLLTGALVFLGGCTSGTGPEEKDRLDLTAEDTGSQVRMAVGEYLEIALEQNPSTGRSWKTDSVDSSVLQYVDETYEQDPSCQPGTAGCGGTVTMRFVAVRSGQTILRLAHQHVDGSVSETFQVTVLVSS